MPTPNAPRINARIRNIPSFTKNPMVDMFMTYQFMKRILTPFEKWDAYKLKIIDAEGNVLKKRAQLTTPEEKAAWGYFDIMVANLKKLLAKVPAGRTLLASAIASYLLIKEEQSNALLDYDYFEQEFFKVYEEVAVNNVGQGNIAGVGVGPAGEPGVKFNVGKLKKMLRRKFKITEEQSANTGNTETKSKVLNKINATPIKKEKQQTPYGAPSTTATSGVRG